MPNVFILAGPNGVGKTTYARRFLAREMKVMEFLNADLIAAGISLAIAVFIFTFGEELYGFFDFLTGSLDGEA